MIVADYLRDAAERLAAAGIDGAEFDARVLLEEALDAGAGKLFRLRDHHVTEREALLLEYAVAQRASGVPLQYVIGRWEFCGLEVALERGILIPRPETEELVEAVLARVPPATRGKAVDLGTGTGAIAIAIASGRPGLEIEAWDLDPRAVRLARRNARLNGLTGRVRVRQGDLMDVVGQPLSGLELLVSNPPYIPSTDIPGLDDSVKLHESHLALDGGPDGLVAIRAVLDRARASLVPGGLVALEMGWNQGPEVRALAEERGLVQVEILQDMAGKDRLLMARQSYISRPTSK